MRSGRNNGKECWRNEVEKEGDRREEDTEWKNAEGWARGCQGAGRMVKKLDNWLVAGGMANERGIFMDGRGSGVGAGGPLGGGEQEEARKVIGRQHSMNFG